MEYRRRSASRRRAASHRQASGGSGVSRAIAALLMIAAIVYLVSASAAGTWIAENIMAPLIESLGGSGSAPATVDAAIPDADASAPEALSAEALVLNENAPHAEATSMDLTLPKLDCYMLQMGVFGESANAATAAEALHALGAGGYVLADGDRFRVIASGYDSEAAAKDVKDRLVGEGVDCTVYALSAAPVTFRVTAADDMLNGISEGFEAIYEAQSAMSSAVLAFDKDEQGVDEGRAAVSAICTKLDAATETLRSYAEGQAVLLDIAKCCDSIRNSLNELINGDFATRVDFSSKMKYTQIYITHEYVMLTETLSSAA